MYVLCPPKKPPLLDKILSKCLNTPLLYGMLVYIIMIRLIHMPNVRDNGGESTMKQGGAENKVTQKGSRTHSIPMLLG